VLLKDPLNTGLWIEKTQQVFLTSNLLGGKVSVDQKSGLQSGLVAMSMLKMESQNAQVTRLPPTASLPTANGACIFQGQLLVCDQGYGDLQPSQLVLVNPLPPHAVTPILNNFHGRPFNSLNDVAVLSTPGTSPPQDTVWFTDPTYGYEQGFKPAPRLPPQVYCFDPYSGNVRAVADGFVKPNGIAFNREATRCYITDTGVIRGCGDIDGSRPGTM
jgi:gluconolactonase